MDHDFCLPPRTILDLWENTFPHALISLFLSNERIFQLYLAWFTFQGLTPHPWHSVASILPSVDNRVFLWSILPIESRIECHNHCRSHRRAWSDFAIRNWQMKMWPSSHSPRQSRDFPEGANANLVLSAVAGKPFLKSWPSSLFQWHSSSSKVNLLVIALELPSSQCFMGNNFF